MNDQDGTGELNPAHPPAPQVPWTARDVWFSLIPFGLWMVSAVLFGVFWSAYSWSFDIGIFMAIWEVVLLLPVWWFTLRKYRTRWEVLGFRKFEFSALAIGCGLMVLTYCFNIFYNLVTALLDLHAQVDIPGIFETVSSPWLVIVTGMVFAPIVEEIFFRGFIFAGLRGKYGWMPAALISSGLFSLVHLQPLSILPIFLMGLIFAYLYQRSNSIWPGVIMHFSINALGLSLAYLIYQNGPSLF